MSSKSFSFSKVLSFGWRVMKSNFWYFAGVSVFVFLTPFLGLIAGSVLKALYPKAMTPFWVYVLIGVIYIYVVILIIGFIRITLRFCDGQKPRFSTLFSGWDCFWRFFAAGILYNLILNVTPWVCILPLVLLSGVGAMRNPFFVVPILAVIYILMVIVAIKFGLCFYFVIDKGLGPINALKASSRATTEAKLSLFIFFILCGLINLLGTVCIVGVFATFPMIMVAMSLVYRHLSEQTPELAEFGISSPKAGPGSIAGGLRNTSGIRLDPAIQAVVNSRPDQSLQSREDTQPANDIQSAAGMQLNSAAQSGTDTQLSQGVRLNPKVQSTPRVQPAQIIQPVPAIQHEEEKKRKSSLRFWLTALAIASVVFAAGIGYHLWSRSKGSAAAAANAQKEGMLLTGILYSEDNPSAIIEGKILKEGDIINGIKVIKIHKDGVELEKDGEKWTLRTK